MTTEAGKVRRFDVDAWGGSMSTAPDGDYVEYIDYEASERQCASLRFESDRLLEELAAAHRRIGADSVRITGIEAQLARASVRVCKCGVLWYPDMDQFGCWSCGAVEPDAKAGETKV